MAGPDEVRCKHGEVADWFLLEWRRGVNNRWQGLVNYRWEGSGRKRAVKDRSELRPRQ